MHAFMNHTVKILCLLLAALVSVARGDGGEKPAAPAAYVMVADLSGDGGGKLSDSLRLRLRRHKSLEVLDRLSTREMTGPIDLETDPAKVTEKMRKIWGVNLLLYGRVVRQGEGFRAEIRLIDLTGPEPDGWVKTFSDQSERWRAVVGKAIVEAVTGRPEWVPPQYGDEPEPENFAKPLNANGDFEDGNTGWEAADNVSTFLEDSGGDRGRILRVRTDLARAPWLAYKRKILLGRASPDNPPKIRRDTSYGSVAGLEGVHFRSEWIQATAGQRYWLTADHWGQGGAKIFVKGFRRTKHARDGVPESRLAAMNLTPEQFAQLPEAKRKAIIEKDAREHPNAYLRECYRWYLNCGEGKGEWTHFAAPVPPRGGLPANVDLLQIQIYSYWPPGTYRWDNVHLYKDPNQKAPLPEEAARTKNFQKVRDAHDAAGEIDEPAEAPEDDGQ
jgi:TolB-like protein